MGLAVALVVALVAILGVRYLGEGNKRHVTALLSQAVADAGLSNDPLDAANYFRDRFNGPCSEIEDAGDRWVGDRAVIRFNPPADHLASARDFADIYEADGWVVTRWDRSAQEDSPGERIVYADRDEDRVQGTFGEGSWTISASSGPCEPFIGPPDSIATFEVVDSF